jgi:hypothetical protein
MQSPTGAIKGRSGIVELWKLSLQTALESIPVQRTALTMITISTEKGLIKVDDWTTITERPGFLTRLDRSDHELAAILGRYVFPEKVHCGLSDCGTPHAKGYIVTTKDGHETNIGQDCGRKFFGVEFQTLANQFDRAIAEQENRELLWNFTFQLEDLEAKIDALRGPSRGADWIHKHSQALINPSPRMPLAVIRKMSSLAKTKSNVVSLQRRATEQEVEDLETIQRRKIERPHYIDEPVALIVGVEVLYPENDLRHLLVFELEEKIKDFKGKNPDLMTFEQLTKWRKWAVSVDGVMDTASSAMGYGRELLTTKNLEPLLKIIEVGQDRAQFRTYLDAIRDSV